MKRSTFLLCISLVVAACGGSSDREKSEGSQAAKDYVYEIVGTMQRESVNKYKVDWGHVYAEVDALIADAKSIKDTYPAITKAFELQDTNHTFLMSESGEMLAHYSELDCDVQASADKPDTADIGYIRVDGFFESKMAAQLNFASNIQNKIKEQDSASIKGWIVDLRHNSGGIMWPMIAGLGPLLGHGIHGYFLDANGKYTSWSYGESRSGSDGASFVQGFRMVNVKNRYELISPTAKIAVLNSKRNGSSGEATLISFKNKDNVKIFGEDSCGLSTANRSFKLSDGSTLYLTTATMTDNEQNKFGGPVPVDVYVSQGEVLQAAIDWINEG